jgi:hypothetical protein
MSVSVTKCPLKAPLVSNLGTPIENDPERGAVMPVDLRFGAPWPVLLNGCRAVPPDLCVGASQQHVAPASPGDHVEGESRQPEECGIDVVNAPVAVGFDER